MPQAARAPSRRHVAPEPPPREAPALLPLPLEEDDRRAPAPAGTLRKSHERAMFGLLAEVGRLTKKHENGFAKYSYASVDQFYEAVRPLCAKYGVRWKAREWTRATVAGNTILYHFAIDLHFADGHQYTDYDRVTVPMSLTGPQVSGAAKSYAMKAFMRATFFMETGESDGDDAAPMSAGGPPADLGARRTGPYNRRSAANRVEDDILADVEAAGNLTDLDRVLASRRHEIEALKATDWSQHARVLSAVEDRRRALTKPLAERARRTNEAGWDQGAPSAPPRPEPPARSAEAVEQDLIRRARACRDMAELTGLWAGEETEIKRLTGTRHLRVKTAFTARRAELEGRTA